MTGNSNGVFDSYNLSSHLPQDCLSSKGRELIETYNLDTSSACLTVGLCTCSHLLLAGASLMVTLQGTYL